MGFRRFDAGYGEGMPRVRNRRGGPSVPALLCALGVVGSAVIGLGLVYGEPDLPVVTPVRGILAAKTPKLALVRHEMALFDPALTSGYAAAPFGRSAPLRSHFSDADAERVALAAAASAEPFAPAETAEPAVQPETPVVSPIESPALNQGVPMPTPRPAFAGRTPQPRRLAQLETSTTPPSAPAIAPPGDGRTLLERMFGAPATTPNNPALAYATPGDAGDGFFGSRSPASAGSGTAVYNIAKHIVTLPDGTQLEAHSGLGLNLDNPNSVTEHMRGATPPTIYELTLRETLFHGVRALRLTPLLEGTTFGRGGLLAHTFMLGPRGDSNGCVVFRNYPAFLAAYDRGQVRRLLVVAGT